MFYAIELTRYVYIATSNGHGVLKLGCSTTPWDRAIHLNSIGYGNIYDWSLHYYAFYLDAGRVELTAHSRLAEYMTPRGWIREGRHQNAREIFKCNFDLARDALQNSASVPGEQIWERE